MTAAITRPTRQRRFSGIGTVLGLAAIMVGALGVGLRGSPVSAAPGDEITFRMDGVVDSTEGLDGSISVGDPFSIVYRFDPTVPDGWPPVGYGIYDAVTSSTVTIGSYSASGTGGQIYIQNDNPNGPNIIDAYDAQLFNLVGPEMNGLQPDYAQVGLQDYSNSGTSVPSEALPTQPLDPSDFTATYLNLQFTCAAEPSLEETGPPEPSDEASPMPPSPTPEQSVAFAESSGEPQIEAFSSPGDCSGFVNATAVASWTGTPAAPSPVSAAAGNGQAAVNWVAPADGGSPITGYTVTASPGGATVAAGPAASSATVTGLSNGTSYTFRVAATNSVGDGPASAASNAVTPAVPVNQTITFANPGAKTMLQSPLTVIATATSGLAVTFTTTTPAICTASGVNGATITFLGPGTCTVRANQAGDGTHNPAPTVTRSFAVSKVNQSITFANPGAKTMLQSPVDVSATASSGLAVTLTSTTLPVCTVSGMTITLVAPGSCAISASQGGSANYNSAANINRNFNVTKASQTITFANPGAKTMIQSPVVVSATTTSPLAVTLTSTTQPICTVSSTTITLLGPGSCTIVASQAGDANWAAAPSVSRTFNVTKTAQAITFAAVTKKILAQLHDVAVNPSASSGLPVTLSSTTPTRCTVSGTQVTLVALGTCRLSASQAGNAIYKAAATLIRSFTIAKTSLQVSGNLIVSPTGDPVRLIGVNRAGSEYMCIQNRGFFEGPSDDTSVQAMASWHANSVRVPLNEDCWLGINGAPPAYSGAAYRNAITAFLALLKAHGMVAILELHWSAAGTFPANGQEAMPNQDHSITFWTQVANAFKGDSNVVFDLFNEPFPDNNQDSATAWQCWRDGGLCPGVVDDAGQPFQAAGMQALVSAVRGTGATNLIFLGGVRFANAMSQWLAYAPVDPRGNLAASWHVYPFNACASVPCWDAEVLPVLNAVPLVASEIGQTDCAANFINLVMPWLDGHGSGYLAWTWDVPFGCQSLITDYAGTPTAPYGAAFRDHLLSIRP